MTTSFIPGTKSRPTRDLRIRARAEARVERRVNSLLALLDANPAATRFSNPAIARADDLLGEADEQRKGLR